MSNGKKIQVIDKTIDILNLFMEVREPLGISEISKKLSIYKSSVHRILNTLKGRGFIIQNEDTKKYWLGNKFYTLGMLYKNKLKIENYVNRYMKELANKFKETVHLAIFDELDYCNIISIDKIEAGHRLSMTPPPGSRSPTHASALGKSMLAYSDSEIKKTVLNSKLEKYTENTIVDKNELKKELKLIKKQGFAFDDEELEPGLNCIASPILDDSREAIASISVSGPKGRIVERKPEIIKKLKSTINEINYQLK